MKEKGADDEADAQCKCAFGVMIMVENTAGHKSEGALPEPLTPPDCDLRGLQFMPLYGDRLFASATWISAKPEARVAMLRLWWHAYAHEAPAASLPDDDNLLAEYAGYGVAIAAWRKVRAQALRGWIKCSNGRLYHQIVADIAREAWEKRKDVRSEADRKRRERDDRSRMFADLKAVGSTPAFNIKTADLREMHRQHVTQTSVTCPVTSEGHVTAREQQQQGQGESAVVDASAGASDVPKPMVPQTVWLRRVADIHARFGAILGADPGAASARHLRDLCEPGTGPPCDWDRDVEPAIDKVLGGYLQRNTRVRSLTVIRAEAVANRDRRLAGLPEPDLEHSHEQTHDRHYGARGRGGHRQRSSGASATLEAAARLKARLAAQGSAGAG